MLKTAKFGGSSVADAKHFSMVKDIVTADPARRVVVVSAPGKRAGSDNKITDLLYLCHAHMKYRVDHLLVLLMIEERYRGIAAELNLDFDVEAMFAEIRDHIAVQPDEDYLVSRGEYMCARLMANYLGFDFVDALGTVIFNFDGTLDLESTYANISCAFERSSGRIVMPGFYGTMPNGKLRLMPRGGSDITGALAAAAVNADLYENWTDVPGILMADPAIVKAPKPISHVTYDELRELTYMGAKVLHEESVFPVRERNIPLNIRDTGNPGAPGTMISESFEAESGAGDQFITGVAGRKAYSVITVRRKHMVNKLGHIRRVLEIFEKNGVPVEHIPSGIDGFSLVVPLEADRTSLYSVIGEIESISGPDSITVTDNISLIAAVGRKMAFRPGISGRLFGMLGKSGINIRMIMQNSEELSIIVGVDDRDFENAISVIYNSFTRKEDEP